MPEFMLYDHRIFWLKTGSSFFSHNLLCAGALSKAVSNHGQVAHVSRHLPCSRTSGVECFAALRISVHHHADQRQGQLHPEPRNCRLAGYPFCFQFSLPERRMTQKPMIWREFRVHNAIFAYRTWCALSSECGCLAGGIGEVLRSARSP